MQVRTLEAICLVLAQIEQTAAVDPYVPSFNLSLTTEHYANALLRPLLNVLGAVSSACLDMPTSSSALHVARAGDVAAMLGLMSTLVSRGVAVAPIIDLLTGESDDLQRLCENFNSLSSSSSCIHNVSTAACVLCMAVMRAVDKSPSHCFELAGVLFSKYARHSALSGDFVEHILEVLGARGSHLQRLKQKIGSTYGEVSYAIYIYIGSIH